MTETSAAVPPTLAPVPTDGVVTLRAHRMSDVQDLVALAHDPGTVARTNVPDPYDHDDALDRIRAAEAGWCDGGTFGWVV